jgi:hypothetical protein
MNNKVIKEIGMLVNFNIHGKSGDLNLKFIHMPCRLEAVCSASKTAGGYFIKAQSQVSEHDSTL